MRKATQKIASNVNLGSKRACPSCGIKFYDFNKPTVICPKCSAKLSMADFQNTFAETLKSTKDKKAPAKKEPLMEGEEVLVETTSDFEPGVDVEESDDLDDIDVEKEEEQESI